MSEVTLRPIVIQDAEDGQFYSNIKFISGNKGISHTSELYTRKEKAIQSAKSVLENFYVAFQSIGFDLARIDELIHDQTKRKPKKEAKASDQLSDPVEDLIVKDDHTLPAENKEEGTK